MSSQSNGSPTPTEARKRKRDDGEPNPGSPLTESRSVKLIDPGRRLLGEVFTVVAGEKRYAAHQTILSKSPVLKKMCSGPFQESETKVIELPDDDPVAVGLLIECLYVYHDDTIPGMDTYLADRSETWASNLLANLYIMADKYQLPNIQNAIIEYLREDDDESESYFSDNAGTIFRIAEPIYNNTLSNKGPFHEIFLSAAAELVRHARTKDKKLIYEIVARGGNLATDLCKAQNDALDNAHRVQNAHLEECKTRNFEKEKQLRDLNSQVKQLKNAASRR